MKDWEVIEDKKLEKAYRFNNFGEALDFVNEVGKEAEIRDHHPDILLFDGNQVKISLTTRTLGSLSEDDFDLAERIDTLVKK